MADALNESTIFFFICYSYNFLLFCLASKVKGNLKLLITTRLEMENEFIVVMKNKCIVGSSAK